MKNKNRITITSVRLTALLAIAACGGRAIGAQQWAVFVSMFWGSILSGAAGHTYGAAGIWHAGVEGDHGNWGAWNRQPYDWTTWREGMAYPGSTQLGIGKRLLEQYPWHRFVPHPEWAPGCFAAGISGEVRFIYQACRSIYNWDGTVVKRLERDVPYDVIYLDPATGRRFDQGIVMYAGPTAPPFAGHTKPMLFEDRFEVLDASAWKDYGTPTRRENARLVGGKGMVTVAAKISELDLMASVDANRDAEAGIILRFHDADNYLVALYSPLLKAIFLHDRKNGQWGEMLGRVDVPEVGPKIHLLAAACGECAALVLADGKKTYHTPTVKVGNVKKGKTGLWLFQIGERQGYENFELSQTPFTPMVLEAAGKVYRAGSDQFRAPNVPSPPDWVLVLERSKKN